MLFAAVCVVAGILFIAATVGYTFNTFPFSLFTPYFIARDNFSTPLSDIHHLKGDVYNWFSYNAWVSFTYDNELALKHSGEYKRIPCTTNILIDHGGFPGVEEDHHPAECEHYLHEPPPDYWLEYVKREPTAASIDFQQDAYNKCTFDLYEKRLKVLLPSLQCSEKTEKIEHESGTEEINSLLIENPHTHQALFTLSDGYVH